MQPHLGFAKGEGAELEVDCAAQGDASSRSGLAQQVQQPPCAVVKHKAARCLQRQQVLLAPAQHRMPITPRFLHTTGIKPWPCAAGKPPACMKPCMKKKNHPSQFRADKMPGPPWDGQLMCTLIWTSFSMTAMLLRFQV